MKNGLETAYELVMEQSKEGTVKTNLTTGAAAAGENKKAGGGMGPESTGTKKPVEGETKINPGRGKIKTEGTQRRSLSNMLPTSKFDNLFKNHIIQEEGEIEGDESPLEMSGENEFDDDSGDFPAEGDDETAEEVDVATELRLIIDRLNEIAEKLGAFDGDMEEAGDETGEAGMEGDEMMGDEESFGEAVQAKMKPFKNSAKKMQQKNNKVQSAFKASGKKAATGAGGPGKGAADGKLGPARKTNLGPKMGLKAPVKGTMGKTGAGVFDNV